MRFRPCIDIHNGKVKQIIGGSLDDHDASRTRENFVSDKDASFFAALYRDKGFSGGHVILLNPAGTPEYVATKEAALSALRTAPGTLMAGGGITPDNAREFLNAGATHVIVTSYVFHEGKIDVDRLKELTSLVGKEQLTLDLSCRKRDSDYVVTTDRWQTLTKTVLSLDTLHMLEDCCDEFLVHAADVEGKVLGIEEGVVRILGGYDGNPVTYAGGISSMDDIARIRTLGNARVDFTVGSALDIFGGTIRLEDLL